MFKKYLQTMVIMRGQVLTNGHCNLILNAIKEGEETLIILGTHNSPRTIKNPFTCEEREKMIRRWLRTMTMDDTVKFAYLEDFQDDEDWILELGKIVFKNTPDNYVREEDRALFTSSKDNDGELRNSWAKGLVKVVNVLPITSNTSKTINATDARNYLFSQLPDYKSKCKALQKLHNDGIINITVSSSLLEWFIDNDYGKDLYDEYQECINYEERYGKGSAHLTSDALVVVRKEHKTEFGTLHYPEYMLIKRGGKVGKNLLAISGGFVDNDETFEDAAIRELEEETGLKLSKDKITHRIVADSPNRDPRARIVSIVHVFDVTEHELKNVKAGDDASEIVFKTFENIKKSELFSDHYDTIKMYHNQLINNKGNI